MTPENEAHINAALQENVETGGTVFGMMDCLYLAPNQKPFEFDLQMINDFKKTFGITSNETAKLILNELYFGSKDVAKSMLLAFNK